MFDRFKRSTDQPAREEGAVATADRPDTTPAGRDTAYADRDRGATVTDRDHDTTFADRDATAADRDRDATVAERERDDTVAERDRTSLDDRPARDRARPTRTAGGGVATSAALETARARQRDEFGGINWGASFFGWLVAVGVAAILTALLAAAGAAIGLTVTQSDVTSNAEEISLGGGIALLVVLMIAYYAGGYVAGRMSRFDGGRQGIGTWVIALVVTVALAVVAVIFGDKYNVLEQLNLPSIPVGDNTLATGGIIAIVAIVVGTLLAAVAGGKVGERYHRRIDRAGFVD